MQLEIQHDTEAQSFKTQVDGHTCYVDYELADQVMTITHTVVPKAVEGRGVASALIQAALDQAKQAHWRVVPVCSYAQAWVERHPDYQDLLV